MASKQYQQERWSLDDLFPAIGSPELEAGFQKVEDLVTAFEKDRERLSDDISPSDFIEVVASYDEMYVALARVAYFGHLKFSADTQDQKAQSLLSRVQQLEADFNNRTLFFELWWKGLDDNQAKKLLEASGDFRYWLEALRHQKPYTLSEPVEQAINTKNVNGVEALVNLYTSITNRYTFEFEVDGEVKELTRGELAVYVRSPDPELRARSYQALFAKYEEDAPILGQIYQYRARDWRSEHIGMRKYDSPLAVRNLSNDVPDEVVDILLDVCQKNAKLFHRYFELKARWLKMDRIRRYDVYAPVAETDRSYAYVDAAQIVLDSFNHFDPNMAKLIQRVFDERHLDAEIRQGKRGGAFCATVEPKLTPYVLMNYNGQPNDVATLAHELGHAVHSLLAADHHAITQNSTLPLAETASTFGEMLLIDHLVDKDPDPSVRRDLRFAQMDDAYATIMRQAYFALFERTAHEMIKDGASVDELHEAYLDNLKDQFGDSLDLSEDFKYEWTAIPHFYHTPFYVYAYSFGQLLVLSLYQQYREEGESFKPRYLEILSAGGSASPAEILEKAGIEFRTEAFWQGGFDVLAAALKDLEGIKIEA
ncbi:MAG: M3 family oligoendopeptidase [Anaerolineales bacterium]